MRAHQTQQTILAAVVALSCTACGAGELGLAVTNGMSEDTSEQPQTPSDQPPNEDPPVDDPPVDDPPVDAPPVDDPPPDEPFPDGTPIGIVVGNGQFIGRVALGEEPTFCGEPWSNGHAPNHIRGVGFGDGLFIAVGGDQNSLMMKSNDGVRWTYEESVSPDASWLSGVAFGNGTWIAAGGLGRGLRSVDGGDTWTALGNGAAPFGSARIRNVHFGGGTFVAIGSEGWVYVSSDDGDTWTGQQVGSAEHNQITYGLGTWVASARGAASCILSHDHGASWSPCPFDSPNAGGRMRSVTFDGSALAVHLDGGIATSTNGIDWHITEGSYPGHMAAGGGLWMGIWVKNFLRWGTDIHTLGQETAVSLTARGTDIAAVVVGVTSADTLGADPCEDNRP